jgi:hypothetical protein
MKDYVFYMSQAAHGGSVRAWAAPIFSRLVTGYQNPERIRRPHRRRQTPRYKTTSPAAFASGF